MSMSCPSYPPSPPGPASPLGHFRNKFLIILRRWFHIHFVSEQKFTRRSNLCASVKTPESISISHLGWSREMHLFHHSLRRPRTQILRYGHHPLSQSISFSGSRRLPWRLVPISKKSALRSPKLIHIHLHLPRPPETANYRSKKCLHRAHCLQRIVNYWTNTKELKM